MDSDSPPVTNDDAIEKKEQQDSEMDWEQNDRNSTSRIDEQREEPQAKTSNSFLCPGCQIWNDVWGFKPERGKFLSLSKISRNTNCLICQSIAAAVNIRRGESESLKEHPESRILVRNNGPFFLDEGYYPAQHPTRIYSSSSAETIIRLIMSLELRALSEDLKSSEEEEVMKKTSQSISMTPQFSLHYSSGDGARLIGIEPWEVSFFDVSLMKTWLRGCQDLHGNQCVEARGQFESDLPAGFRVINVHSLNIVKPAEALRYVALSYMWPQGGEEDQARLQISNLKELGVPGSMANLVLPRIISDTISLCRDLGETYLWVDRLCIIQDDAGSKHNQIRGMDKIYRSATFAIIAALNDRDGLGLPGSYGRPRLSSALRQPYETEVEGRGIKPNGMSALVEPSLWNKRGWTFQERVLSQRRLFITDFQVLFQCSQGQASEELTYCPPPSKEIYHSGSPSDSEYEKEREKEEQERCLMPAFKRPSSFDREVDFSTKDATSLVDYFPWVENYSTRQLTFGSDILNAFAGVSSYLGESFGSRMIFCLPEKHLPQALMWSCLGSAKRRVEMPGIPSWSWASSLNHADYLWINGNSHFHDDLERIASLVYFHFQDPDLGIRKLEVGERWIDYYDMTIKEFENKEEDGIPGLTGKYIPGSRRSNITWQECPHNPWTTLAHLTLDAAACKVAATMPGSLIFNTTVASLKIGQHDRDRYEWNEVPEKDAGIFNRDGGLVGWINKMSLDWIMEHAGDEQFCDFVVVSGVLLNWGKRKTMAQYMKDFDMWRLNVMLVERLQFEPYVVRRVDVGYIFAHKWKDCDARWETVVLC